MSNNDLKKTIKKAIFIADTIEKAMKISRIIDDISEGIEEIEKSVYSSKSNNFIKEHLYIEKSKRSTH